MAIKKNKKQKEDIDFEIKFYEGVLKRLPNFVPVLIVLGDLYTRKGCFEEGLRMDLRLSRLRRDDALVHYNLACSYSLLNRTDEALVSVKRAVELGYADFSYMQRDPDLANLRLDKRFRELFKDIKIRDK